MGRVFVLLITIQFAFSGCSDSNATGHGEVDCIGFKMATWNIANFGASKSSEEIEYIAKTVRNYDALAIQEVSTGPAGAQAVAKLVDELDRLGADWDYVVSDATSGEGSERYAVLWKTAVVKKISEGRLCNELSATVNREPFLVRLKAGNDTFLIAVFHAVPKAKKPNTENIQLCIIDSLFERDHLLLMGDFNASERTAGFSWLERRKMKGAITGQKTSLKEKPDEHGNTLASEYDNIYYETDEMIFLFGSSYNFSGAFQSLTEARKISDHIPVYGCFRVN